MSENKPTITADKPDPQAARIAELSACAGKHYRRKDGKGRIVKVTGYGGIGIHQEMKDGKVVAVKSHIFKTDGIFTPPATKFLQEYEEVPAPAKQSEQII